jgi:assimilatory nitrate reductase catalytic subunit
MGAEIPNCTNEVRTTCPYCGVGCGIVATTTGSRVEISGDKTHPANHGRLCSKGTALGLTFELETRLMEPSIHGQTVTWNDATQFVASGLSRIRAQYGPRSIAFYLSGQLLTEDYYVANKLAKGFIGTPHVDTNSRLCMASSVAGHRRAFGADIVPGCYEDLDEADLIVLVGSNTAWCHPILYQRMQSARARRGTKVVNIDPRRTATSEGSDFHLSLAPGTDVIFWNGLLVWLIDNKLLDSAYVDSHTTGLTDALAQARLTSPSIDTVSLTTGVPRDDVIAFYQLWAQTGRTVTCYSQGVNQSVTGTAKVNAIINCHLATGRIGMPGSGPFSLTGQPNAMGGREVGGLANMLAAHMNFSAQDCDRVQRFWNAPHLARSEGMKAVEMFDAIDAGHIKALWVIGTNPAVSLPDAGNVAAALSKLELLVVSDVVRETDTLRHAHVKLPACGWGEKDGTVTNSERRISRQRAFKAPEGSARPDWRIICDVAVSMGYGAAFDFPNAASVFREHAALSAFENAGQRVFDLSGLASISDTAYAGMAPVQWPLKTKGGTARVFADGRFATLDGAARFVAAGIESKGDIPTDQWPLVLNTGRIRDQWHTMTRTGMVPRLSGHLPEPFVEINPADAAAAGIAEGSIARVQTAKGSCVLRAHLSTLVDPGMIFVPMHWSLANSSAANIGSLVHKHCDPVSGQPDLKGTPATVHPCTLRYYGYALSRQRLQKIEHDTRVQYWSRSNIEQGYAYALALNADFADIRDFSLSLAGSNPIMLDDSASGRFRTCSLADERLDVMVSFAGSPSEMPSAWMKAALTRNVSSLAARRTILMGEDASGADTGPVVCVCHQVGARQIEAIIQAGCRDAASVGASCKAGTNCGSCVPEILRMCSSNAQRCTTVITGQSQGADGCPEDMRPDQQTHKCADPVTG